MNWLTLAVLLVVCYGLGAFPTGVVLGRLFKGIDVRQYGSGKTGATNSLRTLGWKISLAVFVIDVAKGAVSVLLAQYFFPPEYQPWAVLAVAIACMLGHDYSIFIGFGGGRGASTGLGELLAVSPLAVLFLSILGVPLVIVTRYMSLGSVVTSILAPFSLLLVAALTGLDWRYFFFSLACGILIVFKHSDNIQRLLNGTERKLGQKAVAATPGQAADTPPVKQEQEITK